MKNGKAKTRGSGGRSSSAAKAVWINNRYQWAFVDVLERNGDRCTVQVIETANLAPWVTPILAEPFVVRVEDLRAITPQQWRKLKKDLEALPERIEALPGLADADGDGGNHEDAKSAKMHEEQPQESQPAETSAD